jgi:hypothetical protein
MAAARKPRTIDRWFKGWFKRHRDLNRFLPWPVDDLEAFTRLSDNYYEAIAETGACEEDADHASGVLSRREHPAWNHLPLLLDEMRLRVVARREVEGTTSTVQAQYRARIAAAEARERTARGRWDMLHPDDREARLAAARYRFPALANLTTFIECLAIGELMEGLAGGEPG